MNKSINNIDKLVIHSNIFHSLKVPERNKRLNDLQKNVITLRNSIGLLNVTKPKRKINLKNLKKEITIKPITSSIISNLFNKDKKIKRYDSVKNVAFFVESNNDSLSGNNQDINCLYMDRASALKRKNLELIKKMKKIDNKDFIYKTIDNNKKNEIFMTESSLPIINKNNGKHNSLRKILTSRIIIMKIQLIE